MLKFIRGGQVQLHQLRMAKQVIKTAILFALLLGLLVFCISFTQKKDQYNLSAALVYKQAYLYQKYIPGNFLDKFKISYKSYNLLPPVFFLNNPYFIKNNYRTNKAIASSTSDGCIAFSITLFLIFLCWQIYGKKYVQDHKESKLILTPKVLNKTLISLNKLSDLKLGHLHLVKNKETSHILVAGGSGTGKTTCINSMVIQIRQRKNSAIIVDLTGEYISKFYDSNRDYIINPTDERSVYWDIFSECKTKERLSILSESLFLGDNQTTDRFWSDAARMVFEDIFAKTFSYEELIDYLTKESLSKLHLFLKGTKSASLTDPKNDKTSLSIRATLITFSRCLEYLIHTTKKENFNIETWLNSTKEKKDGSFLFLHLKPDQRSIMMPLIRVWMDLALSGLLSLSPDQHRRIWFIMDEMPVLGKLPSLLPLVGEARKYGGCIIAGIQSFSQIYEHYGIHSANSLLDNFATKVIFRISGSDNLTKLSRMFGSLNVEINSENISYGAHEMRDGISISKQQKLMPIITEHDISSLADLESFVMLPIENGISRVKFSIT